MEVFPIKTTTESLFTLLAITDILVYYLVLLCGLYFSFLCLPLILFGITILWINHHVVKAFLQLFRSNFLISFLGTLPCLCIDLFYSFVLSYVVLYLHLLILSKIIIIIIITITILIIIKKTKKKNNNNNNNNTNNNTNNNNNNNNNNNR